MLLCVQNINVDAYADLVAQQIGIECKLTGPLCSFKRTHLSQPRRDFSEKLPGCEISTASRDFEIGDGLFAGGDDFADAAVDRTTRIDWHRELEAK